MKIQLLFTGFLLLSIGLFAQESVNGSGGDATGTGGTMSYSVGQVVYETNSGGSNSEAQGVQQPYEISVISTSLAEAEQPIPIKVYPNPSVDFLVIEVAQPNYAIQFFLFNLEGKLLKTGSLAGHLSSLSMKELPSGTYLLDLKKGENTYQSFKIVKQ